MVKITEKKSAENNGAASPDLSTYVGSNPQAESESVPEQGELSILGSQVVNLRAGTALVSEPTFEQIFDCRVSTARWCSERDDYMAVLNIDPTIKSWKYIQELSCACITGWIPKGGEKQEGITPEQFRALSSSDFSKLSQVFEGYLIPDDEDTDEKKN